MMKNLIAIGLIGYAFYQLTNQKESTDLPGVDPEFPTDPADEDDVISFEELSSKKRIKIAV